MKCFFHKYYIILVCLGLSFSVQAQQQYAFRITFNEKLGAGYSLTNPLTYLSQRSVDRRARYNISVDSLDLPIDSAKINEVLNTTNGILHSTSKWLNRIVILTYDSTLIDSVINLPYVSQVRLVASYSTPLHTIYTNTLGGNVSSNIPNIPDSSNLGENFYSGSWNQTKLCNAQVLHKNGLLGQNMLISIIDVGFRNFRNNPVFDSIILQGRLIDSFNFVNNSTDVALNYWHGANVFSMLGGYLPNTYVGGAPFANYALFVTDDYNTEQYIEEDNFIAAVERADSLGTDVVSASIGASTFDNPNDNYTYADLNGNTTGFAKAANVAAQKGVLVVCAAGNEGSYPWNYILTPGDATYALTVGAVNMDTAIASFSSKGFGNSSVLKPNVCGLGVNVNVYGQSSLTTANGTSEATPIIASFAASYLSGHTNLTPAEIINKLQQSGNHAANPDTAYGYGVPDFAKVLGNTTQSPSINKQDFSIQIFPNPFNSVLNCSIETSSVMNYPISLNIFNALGIQKIEKNIILNKGQINMQINTSDWGVGVYWLCFYSNGKLLKTKMIVRSN